MPVKVLRAQALFIPLNIALPHTKERSEMNLAQAAARERLEQQVDSEER